MACHTVQSFHAGLCLANDSAVTHLHVMLTDTQLMLVLRFSLPRYSVVSTDLELLIFCSNQRPNLVVRHTVHAVDR